MLTTGNGRCNLTNLEVSSKNYNSKFVTEAINGFTNENFIDYLKTIAILRLVKGIGSILKL